MADTHLTELQVSMAHIEGKIDLLVAGQARIFAVINGNGTPGLITKTTRLEDAVGAIQALCKQQCSDSGVWGFLRPVLQVVLGGATLAALGAFLYLVVLHPIVMSMP